MNEAQFRKKLLAFSQAHGFKADIGQITKNPDSFKVVVEATDEADSEALKQRIELFLKSLDNGDYSGREVTTENRKVYI